MALRNKKCTSEIEQAATAFSNREAVDGPDLRRKSAHSENPPLLGSQCFGTSACTGGSFALSCHGKGEPLDKGVFKRGTRFCIGNFNGVFTVLPLDLLVSAGLRPISKSIASRGRAGYMRAMPSYSVKEMFLTLQGEGANSGRVAVFVRFSGCNLWTGREADRGRGKGGCSKWCDTDFVGTNGDGGGKFSSCEELASEISRHWGEDRLLDKNKSGASGKYPAPLVVFTGGEPLLQLNEELIVALHKIGFEIAIETNGTIEVPKGVDWVCVSPKAGSELVVKRGQELKLVIPQEGVNPADYLDLDFEHFFVQALDSENAQEDLRAAIDYCHKHPQWRLSLQSHKYMGIP